MEQCSQILTYPTMEKEGIKMEDVLTLKRKLSAAYFALSEIAMYLDTHPTDKIALDYYAQYQAMIIPLNEEYNKKYGPLTMDQFSGGSYWTWIKDPWPWENVGEEMNNV
jgi:spore coat protein JB